MDRVSPALIELENLLPVVTRQYYHLVLIVGAAGVGKTPLLKTVCRRQNLPYLNVNLTLSERMLNLTSKERPLRARRLLAEILDEQPGDVVALDNIELLFDPALRQDPLACLQGLSRNKTLIAAWSGTYIKNTLTYAEPGHPEYHRYDHPDAAIVVLS
ncbi:MAG: BREX-3 system P-loop-containing protein BrxF [Anaerolineae bacterium]|nr:BREX-3 system P-loop-containing protein BrxF [Anaerolineae bacterium]